ncbi:MAG: thioredoxin domain-containing protein, partial [Cytophagales bacterium]
QLLSLYADAYRITKDPLFKATVYETIAFVKRELTSPEFGFYSALDADSEGEEGKFYVWKMGELQNLIPPEEFQLFVEYFNVNSEGNWEHENNILWAKVSPREFAKSKNIDENVFYSILNNWKVVLLNERAKRIRPGLDDKILTSWNGLMLNGLVDAYRTFNEPEFLDLAIKNANFLVEKLKNKQGLYHNYKDGKASIIGFLEDYAFVIQAFINLYQATFDEKWLFEAEQLTESALKQFIDTEEEFLFFTSKDAEKLIARKKEIFDNVIPASNSQMAINLFLLGAILEKPFYQELAQKMLSKMGDMLVAEPSHLSNWGNLLALNVEPIKEIAISGSNYLDFRIKLDQHFIPNAILVGTNGKSHLPLLQNRDTKENETLIYVCENKTCQLPVNSVVEALKMI